MTAMAFMRGALALLAVAVLTRAFAAAPSGEAIFAARCASCHDASPSADNRAPPKAVLKQMSAARIVRTMDFGAMMSLTYMLDRAEREAVAAYLGVPGEDRAPPPSAYCTEHTVTLAKSDASDWNGWSPAPTNTRYQAQPGLSAAQLGRLRLKWAFGFAGDVNAFAPPAVLGANLFVGSAGGSIYALDARTGCIRWHYQADGPVRTAMLIAPVDDRSRATRGRVRRSGRAPLRARSRDRSSTLAHAPRRARGHEAHGRSARARRHRLRAGRVLGGKSAAESLIRVLHVSRQRGRIPGRGRREGLAVVPRRGDAEGRAARCARPATVGPIGRRHVVGADARRRARPFVRHDRQQLHGSDLDERRGRRAQDRRRRRRVVEAADAGRRVQSVV